MSDVFKKIVRDFKLSPKFIPVFTIAPELELVSTRVADFIGMNFVGEEKPLIVEMFTDALAAFKEDKREADPHVSFAKGLFTRSHLLFAKRYVAWNGDKYQVWSPMFESITAFEERNAKHRVEMADERCPENVSQRSVAMQLAARTLSSEHFRLYFEDYHVAEHYPDREAIPS